MSVHRVRFEATRWLVGSNSRQGLEHLVDTDYDGIWQCGCERSMINGEFCRHMRQVRKRMSDKKRYPREQAMAVAAELCRRLKLVCARMIVAGSLRRRKPMVGDVEILFVPKFERVPDGLFDHKDENQAELVIQGMVREGLLRARIGQAGSTSWGEKNKLAVHDPSGIPVDLFTATDANWFNYLTCRTGGMESNVEVASAAQKKGWKWNPYGEGFTNEQGRIVPVTSEADVFRLAGLPWKEPWERK